MGNKNQKPPPVRRIFGWSQGESNPSIRASTTNSSPEVTPRLQEQYNKKTREDLGFSGLNLSPWLTK